MKFIEALSCMLKGKIVKYNHLYYKIVDNCIYVMVSDFKLDEELWFPIREIQDTAIFGKWEIVK